MVGRGRSIDKVDAIFGILRRNGWIGNPSLATVGRIGNPSNTLAGCANPSQPDGLPIRPTEMARQEEDREDLLREATALVERVELHIEGQAEPWVIGFRRDASASLYVSGDPVFQFNQRNQLRRAFVDGKLVKAERGRLVWLERRRTDTQVQLLRRDFTPVETDDTLALAARRLEQLREALAAGRYELRGQVPEDADVIGRVSRWLDALPAELEVAAAL